MSPLRADILQGDLRSLYLASLLGVVAGVFPDDDESTDALAEMEPQIPPGLGQLTPALEAFVRFMHIDPYLVQAAAEASAPLIATPNAALATAIAQLPRAECDGFLQRMLEGETNLQVALRRRLEQLTGDNGQATPEASRRTIGELLERAKQLRRAAATRAPGQRRR